MASATVGASPTFPDGTTVYAYLARGQASTGGPVGDAAATGVISSSSVTLSGLTEGESYILFGQVGGAWRRISFAVDANSAASIEEHLADTSDAHDASAISYIPASGMTATEVQAALDELASEVGGGGGGAPSGPAGGVLGGTYPNPGFAVDMATQAELDAVAAAKQPLDADLTALAALTTTAFGRALLELADAAAGRTALGTDAAGASRPPNGSAGGVLGGSYPNPTFAVDMATQAELDAVAAAKQNLDTELTALAGLTSAANKLPFFSGSGTAALADLSSFARTLLDDGDALTARTTLGTVPIFNVKDTAYGALGDNSNDDSAEIQLAIDAAEAAGGGIVFFPKGTYICNGLEVAGDNITLMGEGWHSILKQVSGAADGTYLIRAEGTGTGVSTNRFGLTIRDLKLLGRSDTDVTTQFVHLVALSGVSDCLIERVYFHRNRGDAIYLGSGLSSPVERHNERVRIRDCKFDGGGTDNNRNCISLIDGTDVFIERNLFINHGATNRPGAIDIEPNATVYPAVRNIHIADNVFDDILGNAGVIGLLHSDQQADLTTKTQGLFIERNTFRNNGNSAAAINLNFNQTPTATTVPNNVLIRDNHIIQTTVQPIALDGVRGCELIDNYIAFGYDGSAISLGFTNRCMDVRIEGGRIHRTGTSNTEVGIYLFQIDRLVIHRVTFDNIKTLVPFENNGGSPSSSGVDLAECRIIGSATTAVVTKHASHTLTNGATDNRARGNKFGSVGIDSAIIGGGISYRTLLDSSGSHTAARVAGTYGLGQGDPIAISGTGTLYPLNIINLVAADYLAKHGYLPRLRLRGTLEVNDVAPTGNYTFGLHPVTRPGTSGGAGLVIYTIGAAVAGSTFAINTPAADSDNNGVSGDFAFPSDGRYVIGVVTTATVAASSHLHMSAALQLLEA